MIDRNGANFFESEFEYYGIFPLIEFNIFLRPTNLHVIFIILKYTFVCNLVIDVLCTVITKHRTQLLGVFFRVLPLF